MANGSRRRVAVVGDAGIGPGHPRWALAHALGEHLVDRGHTVITGGRGGVMEAACRGARASAAWVPGTTIGLLPGSDAAQANAWVDVALPTGLGHARNVLVAQSDAVIGVGGGAGTLSELAFAWTHRRLVIGLRCGGWSERLAGAPVDERARFDGPLAQVDTVFAVDTAAEAVAVLDRHLEAYVEARRARVQG
jgi:uncharacterized protein (TIGR00725 family)